MSTLVVEPEPPIARRTREAREDTALYRRLAANYEPSECWLDLAATAEKNETRVVRQSLSTLRELKHPRDERG